MARLAVNIEVWGQRRQDADEERNEHPGVDAIFATLESGMPPATWDWLNGYDDLPCDWDVIEPRPAGRAVKGTEAPE